MRCDNCVVEPVCTTVCEEVRKELVIRKNYLKINLQKDTTPCCDSKTILVSSLGRITFAVCRSCNKLLHAVREVNDVPDRSGENASRELSLGREVPTQKTI